MTKTQTKTPARTPDKNRTKPQGRPRDKAEVDDAGEPLAVVNDVRLVGRLSGDPVVVELPSGDALVTFRITVPRSPTSAVPRSAAGTGQRADSVPCTAWSPRLRRSILTWRTGDLVDVSGAVRCRFYQAGGATRSRVEVEVLAARIMRRSSAA